MLRIAAALFACFGLLSFSALSVWTKLTFTDSLDFWDFTASLTPFFGHWAGVVAVPAIFTHYFMGWLRGHPRDPSASKYLRKASSGDASGDIAQA